MNSPSSKSKFSEVPAGSPGVNNPAASYESWLQFLAYQQQYQAYMNQQQQQQPQQPQQYAMPYMQKRWRRAAAIEEPSLEDIQEFNADLAALKESYLDGVSNLTCVLMTMGALDNNFMVNKQYFVKDMWNEV
mgnify:CR=1 FL=1